MTDDLVVKCKLFVKNRDILKKTFQWSSTEFIPLCSYMYTVKGEKVDPVRINECKQLIKKENGVFTKYKGDMLYPLATLLSLQSRMEKGFNNRVKSYEQLKKEFSNVLELPFTAYFLEEQSEEKEAIVEKAVELKEALQSLFAEGFNNDFIYFVLAKECKGEEKIVDKVNECLVSLSDCNLEDNVKTILAMTLAMGEGDCKEKAERFLQDRNELRKRQCYVGEGFENIVIALLSRKMDNQTPYIENLAELNTYLKCQKGFGVINIGAHQRLMYAALLILGENEDIVTEYMGYIVAMTSEVHAVLVP